MNDDKEFYERYQIGGNYEDRLTDDIKILKQGNLISQKNIGDIEKEYDESNQIDTFDDKEYDERDHIGGTK